jgi:Na+-driven multidrug efflux pump
LNAPEEIIEPARIGLLIMLPWTWSIAYRRFHQGVLIRFGYSKSVGAGTLVRLFTNLLVLITGFLLGSQPGIVVATSAVSAGVLAEAIYVGWVVRPVLRTDLRNAPPIEVPLSLTSFLAFYIPLIFTSLLTLLVQPIGSAALSRMPQALASLAAWPVVSGLVFVFRSPGLAYNEVIVALLDEPHAVPVLRRFAALLAGVLSLALFVMAATPLGRLWFSTVSGLSPELANLATSSLWFALLQPAVSVLQSWYQGALLNARATRGISEAVAIFLLVCALVLGFGTMRQAYPGIFVGWVAFTIAMIAQAGWLHFRGHRLIARLEQREKHAAVELVRANE